MMDEAAVRKRVYPDIPVHVEFWCGHPALRIPHVCNVCKVDDADKEEAMALLKSTLRASRQLADHSLKHHDAFR